ncbi:hypothetical protein [Cellulophaga lytica]|uniref:Uncharacterized protein n=1 Tax=Cellulophaga lytica (strain ATCC 23178 / DSM 7489 / JCM 8516 / NBRC 14961 / NCIMB 1423 / VKM B-1433 / Cy l20) TaxID=867900 RepID=F0RGH0_CELLC|nr:hypothetical protein [Cellulophaga lytica]ADY27995.1 hypothetical protein Celly_0160 [Cellulophaga lytica DSM 7489]WQG77815.1 hypothetical protein SR888_02585 [Cellulophaga lytica]
MQQFIINTKATYIKNILLTDSKVRLSDEDYKTLEAFNIELDSDKKGLLNTQHTFEYTAIQKIVPFKEDLGFQVFFTEKGKNEKAYLDFKTDEEYQSILNTLVSKTNFSKNKVQKKTKAWIKPSLYSLVAALLTFALYDSALKLEAGENVTVSGSRRGLKRILLSISESLGATNSLILGSLITLVFIFFAFKAYKKSVIDQEVYN